MEDQRPAHQSENQAIQVERVLNTHVWIGGLVLNERGTEKIKWGERDHDEHHHGEDTSGGGNKSNTNI